MHDVDVRLILKFISSKINQIYKKIYFKIHGIVHCKGKNKKVTIHLEKKVWAIKIWKILENKGEVLVF